jgi:hypothetical protein
MSQARAAIAIVAAFAVLAAAAASARAQGAAPEAPAPDGELRILVRDLGSPSYRTREDATRRLGSLGLEAVAPVAAAAQQGDLEVAIRSLSVLEQLALSEDEAAADAATAALESLHRSQNHSLSWRAERALTFVRHWAVLAIESMGGRVSVESGDRGQAVAQIKLEGVQRGGLSRLQQRALKQFPVLVIAGGDVGDNDVAFLSELLGLQHLDLRYTQVGDAGLAHLRPVAGLQKLLLSGTRLSNQGLADVGRLAELRVLYLSGTEVGDAGLLHLAPLVRLEEVNLSQCKGVTDQGAARLTKLTSLKQLNLTGTQLTDEGLSQLAALRSLEGLYLHGTQVSEEGVQRFRAALPGCRVRH